MEVLLGLLLAGTIVFVALKREESLPESEQLHEEVAGTSYTGGLKAALTLFVVAIVLAILGAGG